ASLFDDELLDWYRQHLDGCTAGKLDDEESHASLCRARGDGAPEFYEHWKREGETICMPAMTTHRTAKDHHDEITRAEVFLRGVEVELGRRVLRELLLSPCGYKPGSDWKVAVLSERYRLGLP